MPSTPIPTIATRKTAIGGVAIVIYLLVYFTIRWAWQETWEKDGKAYVIFPSSPIAVYFAFRPLMFLDGMITGMRFHIGPHH